MPPKLLIVDDDDALRLLLQSTLPREGYQVLAAGSGLDALRLLFSEQPDLVLLDVMMPGMDGWEVLERIREVSTVPVIMLTAVDGVPARVRGLAGGADDYVVKPFHRDELVARVEALLRRAQTPATTMQQILSFNEGKLVIDPEARRVMVCGAEVRLTPTEYRLLLYLAQNAGRVLTYAQILDNVWGSDYEGGDRNVKVYAVYLRRKIEPDPQNPRYVLSEWGVGYYMPRL